MTSSGLPQAHSLRDTRDELDIVPKHARHWYAAWFLWLGNEYLHVALYLLLALAGMFWAGLQPGRTLTTGAYLYSTDQLYHEVDSAYHTPLPQTNAVASDYSPFWMFYPEDIEAARAFRSGYYPLWNPYNAAGTPLLGDGQSSLFNPEKLPLYLAGPRHVMQLYSFMLLARLLFAGWLTYLFARLAGLQRSGGLLAGIAFMFCGINLTRFQFADTTSVTLFPLLMVAAEWLIRHRGGRATVLLGVALGLVTLSGHPEVALFTILGAAVYYLSRLFTFPEDHTSPGGLPRNFLGSFSNGLIAGGIGLAISLAYLLPFFELIRYGGAYITQAGVAQQYSIIWQEMLLPLGLHFFYLTAPPAYEFNAGIGVLAIGLVVFAPFKRGAPRALFFLLLWSFLVLFVFPPGNVIKVVPLVIHSYYNMGVVAFALAILAGFGLQRLTTAPLRGFRDPRLLLIWVEWAGLLLLAILGIFLKNNPAFPFPLARLEQQAVLSPVLESSAAFLLYAVCRWLLRARFLGPALVLLATIFLILNGQGINPGQKPFTYPLTRPIAWLKQDLGPFRSAAFASGSLIPNTGMVHQLATTTVDEVFQTQRFRQLALLFPTWNTPYKSVILFTSFRLHLLNLLNTKYLIVDRGQPIAQRVQKEQEVATNSVALTPVYSDAYTDIYENSAALPRAFVVHQARYFTIGDPGVISLVNDPATDFSHLALIEIPTGNPPPGLSLTSTFSPSFDPTEASVALYAPNHVTIRTASRLPGYLILSDAYYPGWIATVDGHPVKIYPADYLVRGIALPGGLHTVEFRYDPPLFKVGLGMTLATLLFALAYLLWTTAAAPKEQPVPAIRPGYMNAPDSTRRWRSPLQQRLPRQLHLNGYSRVGTALLTHAGAKSPGHLATIMVLALLLTISGFLPLWQGLRPLAPDPTFTSFIQFPADVAFGKEIKLTGYDWSTTPVIPGTTRTLRLYLNALQTPQTDYTLFFHLVNVNGQEWALGDHLPNATPTTQWHSGETIIDQSDLAMPAELSPGVYQLKVGLYNSITQQRLPVHLTTGNQITPAGGDSLLLVSFPVTGQAASGSQ